MQASRKGWPDYVLHQMVTVLSNGEEVKISKRAGSYVTLRDLIDEVGCDATRYFLAARHPDSQLVFDIDLAKSKSNDNPVYYIQYAHARISAVLAQWGGERKALLAGGCRPAGQRIRNGAAAAADRLPAGDRECSTGPCAAPGRILSEGLGGRFPQLL